MPALRAAPATEPVAQRYDQPEWDQPKPRPQAARGKLGSGRRRALLIGLILACFLISFGGIYGVVTLSDAMSAARDAKAQAQAIEGILRAGNFTDATTLTTLKGHLQSLENDLNRIQSDIPGGPVGWAVGNSVAGHTLNMAHDLTSAGLYAVDAGLLIVPHIKGILDSVIGGGAKAGSGLTLSEINQASADVQAAGRYVTQALVERAQVSDSALQTLGLGSLIKPLRELDAVAPKLPAYLTTGENVLAALPDLLGMTKPANYLLLDLDSDELRPTGGFQGVYGILTFSNGLLTSGVHLKNIYALECPSGPNACNDRQLPSAYDWFVFHDGLRNANLDPSYPTSAQLDEQLLQEEHGPAVSGVISITPLLIEQILAITGPVKVSGYPDTITAQNFRELIHYYHDLIGQNNVTQNKVFDAAASSSVLSAVSHLSQADQFKVVQLVYNDLYTGDVNAYFNNQDMEAALTALNRDGALQKPAGDTYEVVNSNRGGNYANMDVVTTQSDSVVVDAQGVATHTLSITYNFPVVNHRFPSVLVANYFDDIEVLAPPGARLQSIQGCARLTATEPGWADFACDLYLTRGSKATVVFKWTIPNVTQTSASGAVTYDLLVQRQSGSFNNLNETITLPADVSVQKPLMAGLTQTTTGTTAKVNYTAPLDKWQALSVVWKP